MHLLQQMGIYPDPAKRAKRPKLKSVGLMMVAMARMRYPPSCIPFAFCGQRLIVDG